MELSEHNGWENKFTWLMHLHLSTLREWFRETMDAWFNLALRERQQSPAVLMLVHNLMENVCGTGVSAWIRMG